MKSISLCLATCYIFFAGCSTPEQSEYQKLLGKATEVTYAAILENGGKVSGQSQAEGSVRWNGKPSEEVNLVSQQANSQDYHFKGNTATVQKKKLTSVTSFDANM
jgi:hypothetical protein